MLSWPAFPKHRQGPVPLHCGLRNWSTHLPQKASHLGDVTSTNPDIAGVDGMSELSQMLFAQGQQVGRGQGTSIPDGY
jgi:hypothetical protein